MIRELVLWLMLSACAYRGTRLVTRDTFPPVLWLRDKLAGGWRPMTDAEWRYRVSSEYRRLPAEQRWQTTSDMGDREHRWIERASWSPDWLAELITCPWCASAYVSGILVAATDLSVGVQWPWLMGGAVWAVSALLGSREWA